MGKGRVGVGGGVGEGGVKKQGNSMTESEETREERRGGNRQRG